MLCTEEVFTRKREDQSEGVSNSLSLPYSIIDDLQRLVFTPWSAVRVSVCF